jgi:hypothetical protein
VSYLIIIGDLMPQVVGSIFPGSKSMPFLLDRQFWITSFMYICLRHLANDQACDYSIVVSETVGFVEVYFCDCVTGIVVPCVDRRRTLPHGRYT